jgi:hypothetical protein
MYYVCKLCGKHKQLRKSKKAQNPRSRYLDLEKKMKASKIVHLHQTFGTRNLCSTCLQALVAWQSASAPPKKTKIVAA